MEQPLGVQIEFPGLEAHDPLDLSLRAMKYAEGSLEELTLNAYACSQSKASISLFVHVLYLNEAEPNTVAFCFAWSSTARALVTPFSVKCTLEDLITTVHEIKPGGTILKIDERWEPHAARALG